MPRTALSRSGFWRAAALACAVSVLGTCVSPTAPYGPTTTPQESHRANGILLTATARLAGTAAPRLEVTLHALNETDFWAETGILGGPCMLRPRLYRPGTGTLAWSAFDLHDACPDPLRLIRLDGGDEEHIRESFDTGVPGGTYRVTVTIEHGSQLVELTAGEIVMP